MFERYILKYGFDCDLSDEAMERIENNILWYTSKYKKDSITTIMHVVDASVLMDIAYESNVWLIPILYLLWDNCAPYYSESDEAGVYIDGLLIKHGHTEKEINSIGITETSFSEKVILLMEDFVTDWVYGESEEYLESYIADFF